MQNKLIEQASFFGLRVSVFTYENLVDYIQKSLESENTNVFFGYSIGAITRLKFQPEIYRYINDSDLMVTDGRIFYLLSRLFGLPLKYEISIPYLTELVLSIADEKKYSVMIIGSTEENNALATENVKNKYTNLIVYDGYHGGDFGESEHKKLVFHINKFKPDILLIGVSSPKKEYFTFKNKSKLKVKIIIPCGGMIDVLSGKSVRIPRLVKKMGFGWAWRAVQEPNRFLVYKIWQIFTATSMVFPKIIYYKFFKKNSEFFLPSIFGITKNHES
jgi:N-acetylglucosaminyldiphosphoundecaprenol N-acetyl-beta-D-mannosaminyltransferase